MRVGIRPQSNVLGDENDRALVTSRAWLRLGLPAKSIARSEAFNALLLPTTPPATRGAKSAALFFKGLQPRAVKGAVSW